MSGIVASWRQRKCRNLFKEAVAFAKEVIADVERKSSWQKKLRKRNAVYNAAIKEYMLREKKAMQQDLVVTKRLLRDAMIHAKKEKWLGKNECKPSNGSLVQQRFYTLRNNQGDEVFFKSPG